MPLGQGAEPALPAGPEPEEKPLLALGPKRPEGREGEGLGLGGPAGSPSERLMKYIRIEGPRSDGQGWGTQINQPNPGFTEAGMEAPRLLLKSEEKDRQRL